MIFPFSLTAMLKTITICVGGLYTLHSFASQQQDNNHQLAPPNKEMRAKHD